MKIYWEGLVGDLRLFEILLFVIKVLGIGVEVLRNALLIFAS